MSKYQKHNGAVPAHLIIAKTIGVQATIFMPVGSYLFMADFVADGIVRPVILRQVI